MAEEVKHIQVNGTYEVEIERAANVKTDGFKVKARADARLTALNEAIELYHAMLREVDANKPVQPPAKEK